MDLLLRTAALLFPTPINQYHIMVPQHKAAVILSFNHRKYETYYTHKCKANLKMHKTNKTTEPKWPRGNCAMRGCQHSVNYCYIVSQNRFSKHFVPNKLKKRKK